MNRPPTDGERLELKRLSSSLYDWAFNDLRAAVDCGIPRLAFVGLAAWIDTVTLVFTGGKGQGKLAWGQFFEKYVTRYADPESVELLDDGLRNALLHDYGTRWGIALTHEDPREDHWEVIDGRRVLHIGVLLDEFEDAFRAYLDDLQGDAELRYRAQKRTPLLLGPLSLGGGTSAARAASGDNYEPAPNAPPRRERRARERRKGR